MDHLRYSSFDLGIRVFQFLIPFMVMGSCTEILVSWIITHVSPDAARVLCFFLTNEGSCTKILQKYSYYNNCASSNALIPRDLSTKYADAPPPDGSLPHLNHAHNGNEANGAQNNEEQAAGANNGDDIDPIDVEDGMGGNDGGNNDDGDGGNDDDGDGGEGNDDEDVVRENVVLEMRTIDDVHIQFIETNICALDYGSWDQFAGAIFNFRSQWLNLLNPPQVQLMYPIFCWPRCNPTYGYWDGEVFVSWDWNDYEWDTINDNINRIVLRETRPENGIRYDDANDANDGEGANGAQNDAEDAHNGGGGANNAAQDAGEAANNAAQNGGEGANHAAQNGRRRGANNAAQNEGGANDHNKAAFSDGVNGNSAKLVRKTK